MTKLRMLGVLLLIVAVVAIALPGTAAAQFPPTPYRCTVFIDGAPAPAGTAVEVYMGGILRDTGTTGKLGFDANVCIVMVAGTESDLGEDVSFVAHGVPATEAPDIAYTLIPQQVRLDVADVVLWTFPHGLSQNPTTSFLRYYDGADVPLPTGTEPEQLLAVWHYDEDQMEWFSYVPGWANTLTKLENGGIYYVIVSDACAWSILSNPIVPPAEVGDTWTFSHGLIQDPSAMFPRLHEGSEVSLPTGTEPLDLLAVWYYDETAMEWLYYVPGWANTLTKLENGGIYPVIVSDACEWMIPQS